MSLKQNTQLAPPQKHSFLGDALKLASGTMVAQLLTVAAAPVLARLYSPEAFGALALYFSVVNIVSETAALRYDLSIVLPETEKEASNQLAVSLALIILTNLVFGLLLWKFGARFLALLNTPSLTPFVGAILFGAAATAVMFVFNYWNSRLHRFGWLTAGAVINTLAMIAVQLVIGFSGDMSARGLVLGSALGPAVVAIYLTVRTLRADGKLIVRSINWEQMKQGMRRYQKFPRFDLWGSLLSLVAWQIPLFLLAYFFSSTIVGFYSMGMRLLQVPIRVIGQAVGQSIYPWLREARGNGGIPAVTASAFRRLVLLTLFPLLALAVVGQDVFSAIFGQSWQEAGRFVQILSVWVFFWFVSVPLGSVLNVLEKQELNLQINALNLVTRLVSLVIGGLFKDVYLALGLFSATGILVYGYFSLTILFAAGVGLPQIWRILSRAVVSAVPYLIALVALKMMNLSPWAMTAAAAVAIALHLINFFRHDRDFVSLLSRASFLNKSS